MIYAGKLDIYANRYQPFSYLIDAPGLDFTGATMAMQVREYPDAQGAPLLDLSNATPPAQGLSVSVAMDGEGIPTSTFRIIINETTIEGLVAPPVGFNDCGNDVTLYYDLVITGGGYPKTRWAQGKFIILAGVTQ